MLVAAIYLLAKKMFFSKEPSFRTAKYAVKQAHKKILPFVAQFRPALKGLKNILLDKWH